jgi:hypothetical protein
MKEVMGSSKFSAALRQHISDLEASRSFYQKQISIKWSEIAVDMQRFVVAFPDQVRILAQNGWFTSDRYTPLDAVYPIADLFRAGRTAEGHAKMRSHFADIHQNIQNYLTRKFPDRRGILLKGFQAHNTGDYELSVPVFLAQAEGIAQGVLGESIYSSKKIQAKEKRKGFLPDDGLDGCVLRLVLGKLPLTECTNSPAYRPEHLNRHAVLHGIDTKYGTEINSYKAISWLQYAAQFDDVLSTLRDKVK